MYDAFAQSSVRQYFADSRGRTVCALFGRDLLRVGAPNWLQGMDTITHVLQQILPFVRLFADTGSRERQHFFFFFFWHISQYNAIWCNLQHKAKPQKWPQGWINTSLAKVWTKNEHGDFQKSSPCWVIIAVYSCCFHCVHPLWSRWFI